MANTYNAAIPTKVQTILTNLANSIGNGFVLNLSESPGFSITLKLTPDGQFLAVTEHSEDQGQNLRPAFKVDTAKLP